MPLATCTITGTIYDVNGVAVAGVNVYVDKLEKSGSILQRHRTRVATSDSAGLISFAVPRSSTIWLSGQFFIGSTSYHVNGGVMLAVPEAATATLESLEALPTEGIVVQSDGTRLANLVDTLNFSDNFTVTETEAGTALVESIGGGGALDADLAAIAALTPSNDDVIQRKSGAWTNRTIAQLKTDLGVSGTNTGDQDLSAINFAISALGSRNAANGYPGLNASGLIADSQIPSSIARDSEVTAAIDAEAVIRAAADALLQPLDSDLTAIAGLSPSNDDFMQRKAGAWANRTVAQVKTDLAVNLVDNVADLSKPISTATQTALDLKVDENAAITGATKTKITYDAKGLVTAGADATTADIADSLNKRYVTDANLTTIGNQSGVNTGDQDISGKANDADVVHDTGNETIAGVKTFSSDPIIPDEAYGVGWNGSLEPPTKNAVYDKIETLGSSGIGGSTGATDNAILRADGTGGATAQNSLVSITDGGGMAFPDGASISWTHIISPQISYNSGYDGSAIIFEINGIRQLAVKGGLNLIDAGQYKWSSSGEHPTVGVDTGLARAGAGKIKPTNGSSGYGEFEMAASVRWLSGAGTPEGAVTANIGSLYTRTDGGANTTLYVKESGTGNTGWVAK